MCTVPSLSTTSDVPLVFDRPRSRLSVSTGPNGIATPTGSRLLGGAVISTAPRCQRPSGDDVDSIAAGTVGEPNGRGVAISPFASFAGNPKYDTYGTPSAVSATASPCPTSSSESTTKGTNRSPVP